MLLFGDLDRLGRECSGLLVVLVIEPSAPHQFSAKGIISGPGHSHLWAAGFQLHDIALLEFIRHQSPLSFNVRESIMRRLTRAVNAQDLRLIYRPKAAPAFRIGDRVRLNSGGPVGLIVDFPSKSYAVVAWPSDGAISEAVLPRACLADA